MILAFFSSVHVTPRRWQRRTEDRSPKGVFSLDLVRETWHRFS
jgi:hypothetical protein